MKKIYISFAFIALLALSTSAQNNKFSDLSEDVKASFNFPVKSVDLSSVQQQQKGAPVTIASGCDTLGTIWSGGNSQNGNMFDLTNTSTVSIQIISFSQCFATLQADSFDVYYKTGTFSGFEALPGSWTLAGRVYMAPTVTLTPIPVPITLTVTIPPGGTYGFYLTNTIAGSNNAYTNGLAQGSAYKSKNGLDFKEGRGNVYPFGSAFGTAPASRIWNGVINFCSPLITGVGSLSTNPNNSSVYPNPMVNATTINISNTINVANALVKIYDMTGRLVFLKDHINENVFNLDLNLKTGLYVVQVENNNSIVLNTKVSVQ